MKSPAPTAATFAAIRAMRRKRLQGIPMRRMGRNVMRMFGLGTARPRRALVQYACGDEHRALLAMTRPIHAAYCDHHRIDYLATEEDVCTAARGPYWAKVDRIIEALRSGYEQVAWLDTDCVVVDASYDIFDASGFGIAVCECFDSPSIERHFNVGVLLVTDSPHVRAFLDTWYAMPTSQRWPEQEPFIELMAARPHRDLLTILPNRFNCLDIHMEARDPIIRTFHGDGDRVGKVAALVAAIGAAGASTVAA
jgi:hypothetical protein